MHDLIWCSFWGWSAYIYMFSLVILLKYLIIAIEFTRVVLYTAVVDEQAWILLWFEVVYVFSLLNDHLFLPWKVNGVRFTCMTQRQWLPLVISGRFQAAAKSYSSDLGFRLLFLFVTSKLLFWETHVWERTEKKKKSQTSFTFPPFSSYCSRGIWT